MDSQAPAQLSVCEVCEVCGAYFETRRGLSNHARLHLRQLGVSEMGAAPIDLLYQLIKERDGALPSFKADSSVSEFSSNHQRSHQGDSSVSEESSLLKAGHRVMTTPQSTSLLPLSAPALRLVESRLSEAGSTSSLESLTKPLWAPLETDAPITLDATNEVHVCHLCGSWYETRKGLSSHARAHLRQLGIPDSELKGSPIDILYQLMEEEELKPVNSKEVLQSSSSHKPSKRLADPSKPLMSTPSKKPKTSAKFSCILCGEKFENHKGLAIHARYHLRHFGINDLLGKNSSIEAVQELVDSGVLKSLHIDNSPAAPSSPSAQPLFPESTMSPQTPNHAPKAKKGFRLAVDPLFRKPKPELMEADVSNPLMGCSSGSRPPMLPSAAASKLFTDDAEKPPTVPCEYCGQLFDTRKALSCHVRCHLRELGVTPAINTSPIELLREIMMDNEDGKKLSSGASGFSKVTGKVSRRSLDSPVSSKPTNLPLDYSIKDKSQSGKLVGLKNDTSCELCGFDFDNRKALASHARAHLRQLAIEWRPDGSTSPIDLLSEIIRRDPSKVTEITHRYRMGDLYIKKSQRPSSPSWSTDSDSVQSSSLKERAGKENSVTSSLKQSQGRSRTMNTGVHFQRGAHPQTQKISSGEDNQETSSQQAVRTGSIPAMLPKPPLTPLVKLVGKVYSLKCRFCEEVFHGPLSVQEKWISHLQKHIRTLGYKGKASPPAAPVKTPALVQPVAV